MSEEWDKQGLQRLKDGAESSDSPQFSASAQSVLDYSPRGPLKLIRLLQMVRKWSALCRSKGKPSLLSVSSCPLIVLPRCITFSSSDGEEEEECMQGCRDGESGGIRHSCSTKSSSSSSSSSCASSASSSCSGGKMRQPTTPRGYLAMYVGEERRRFLVKASFVNHPLFSVLLEKAKEEFGFEQQGPLNIPCEVAFFEKVLLMVETSNSNASAYRKTVHTLRRAATAPSSPISRLTPSREEFRCEIPGCLSKR